MRVSLYTEMCIKGYNSIFALHDRNSFVLIYSDLLWYSSCSEGASFLITALKILSSNTSLPADSDDKF